MSYEIDREHFYKDYEEPRFGEFVKEHITTIPTIEEMENNVRLAKIEARPPTNRLYEGLGIAGLVVGGIGIGGAIIGSIAHYVNEQNKEKEEIKNN